MAGIVRDEAAHNPKRGFSGGGYELETLSLGIPFMAAFLNPVGRVRRSRGSPAGNLTTEAPTWLVCGSLARICRRSLTRVITALNSKIRDKNEMPVADVHYDDFTPTTSLHEKPCVQSGRAARSMSWPSGTANLSRRAAISQHAQSR